MTSHVEIHRNTCIKSERYRRKEREKINVSQYHRLLCARARFLHCIYALVIKNRKMAERDDHVVGDFEEEISEEDVSFDDDGLGIAPYMYEPESNGQESVEADDSPPEPSFDDRLGNTNW